jgi:CBS domain-containing protein
MSEPFRSAATTIAPTASSPTARQFAQGKPFNIDSTADVSEVLHLMEQHQIRRLPVIESHRLVGMITEAGRAARRLTYSPAGTTTTGQAA